MKRTLHTLRVPSDVAELIRSLHPHLKKKIRSSLQAIISDPDSGKALKEELAGLRSFRVGNFRIIYRVGEGAQIEIIAVGPRKNIYDETYKLLKKGR